VHLREEVTRKASLEVSKAWEEEEEEADQGDQGEEQDPILHAIAVQRDTERERERERERVHKSAKNTQNFQTEKRGVKLHPKTLAVIFFFFFFLWLIFAIFWEKTSFI
jgi:Fe2+ transport system protein B